MGENLTVALLLTLMGMGLVFGTILLFWVLIRLLVRVTSKESSGVERVHSSDFSDQGTEAGLERDLKRRAALAAVAVVLVQERHRTEGAPCHEPGPFPLPPTALVSTWQAVMRARLLGERRTVR
jgi:Na+-transporting methylmalonyl-CoA/oxaloacetate decarboxylase gamma subunit